MAWACKYHQVTAGFDHLSNSTTSFRTQARGGVQSYPATHTERGKLGLMKSIQSQCRLQWPHQRSPPTQRFFASVAFPLLDTIWIFLNCSLIRNVSLFLLAKTQVMLFCILRVQWLNAEVLGAVFFVSSGDDSMKVLSKQNFSIFLNNYKLILINTCFLKKWTIIYCTFK